MTDYACRNEPARALAMLRREPRLGRAGFYAACAVGEAGFVAEELRRQPLLAVTVGGPRQWPPLLYACFSDIFRTDRTRQVDFMRVVRELLRHGADPNAGHTFQPGQPDEYRLSALYGAAGAANHAGVTKLLLAAGANPDDGESLYHSAEFKNSACTRLLLEHGAKIPGTNAVHRKLDFEDRAGLQVFLDHGADPNLRSPSSGDALLHHAIEQGRGRRILELLADRGADLRLRNRDGWTPYQQAARLGHGPALALLRARGVAKKLTPQEEFIAAAARGDARAVAAWQKQFPGIVREVDAADRGLLARLAWNGKFRAVRVMLAAGFDPAARGIEGATALHNACWMGNVPLVQLLLAARAPVNAMEPTYQARPLGWALHGSNHCLARTRKPRNQAADYPGVVAALLAAGAERPAEVGAELPVGVRAVLLSRPRARKRKAG